VKVKDIFLHILPALAVGGLCTVIVVGQEAANAGHESRQTEPAQTTDYWSYLDREAVAGRSDALPDGSDDLTVGSASAVKKQLPTCMAPENERVLSDGDKYLLAKIIMAEAEAEPLTGQALVGLTILSRVASPRFPDTVYDVIFQDGQFTPVSNGRWDLVEPDDSCKAAVHLIGSGWDESQGATYFESDGNNSGWHEENLEYLFTKGGHKFYREPAL